ncbi:MAG: hypothetical protein ACRDRA_20615 [Pseudonocardiaceae bacterium]
MTASGPRASRPGAPDLLTILESVVAPVTALTALMYYFGLLHAYWFLQTFGVEYTVMGFTTYDYLLRSADGLFVPIAVVAGTGLAVAWTYGPLAARIPPAPRRTVLRVGPHVALGAGSLLLVGAIIGVVRPRTWYPVVGLPGLALALGVLAVNAAVRMYRARTLAERAALRGTPAFWEWAAVFLLVNIGLFWAAADYSAAVGGQRGADVVAALPGWPDVVLYSERALNLSAPGVRDTICADPESAYRYRYDGLKLILQSGDQYLFLPEGWTPNGGSALVMPRTDALRLDFATAGTARNMAC